MTKKILAYIKQLGRPFWFIVFIPTLLSAIYFGLIASDVYVSVSNFVVRSPQKTGSVTGLSAILQGAGFSRSQDDAYVVHQYMLSRDAMKSIDDEMDLRKSYGNKNVDVSSRFNPLGFDGSLEALYDYYTNKVKIDLDSASSISTLTVRAYNAQDAFSINAQLIEKGEAIINQLNERGRQDMVDYANSEVAQAEERVEKASVALADFRLKNKVFDVEKQSNIILQQISKLQDQLVLVGTQLAQVRAVTPNNPQIRVLLEQQKALNSEIDNTSQKMLGAGQGSLNSKAAEYEKVSLEKEFASKQLTAALTALEQYKNDVAKKQLYLERIAQPQVPDMAIEPHRARSVLATFILSLILWGVATLLLAGLKEHQG